MMAIAHRLAAIAAEVGLDQFMAPCNGIAAWGVEAR